MIKEKFDKIPPSAVEVEQAVLGALILERDAFYQVAEMLSVNSFYDHKHQLIFDTVANLINSGKPVDLLMVTQELKSRNILEEVGGPLYITQLANMVASAGHIEHHARIIQDAAVSRELICITGKYNQQAYDQHIDVEETLSGLQNDLVKLLETGNNQESTIADAVREVEVRIESNLNNHGLTGIGTGLTKFDQFTGGLQPTDLVVIAAESSQGKTSLALTILKNAVFKYGAKAAVYSLEMSKSQLTARIIAQETGISAKKILNKALSRFNLDDIQKVTNNLKYLPVFFDERSNNSIDHICNSIRKLKLKHGINLVVVDYLQLINSNLKNKTDESQIADITRRLKNISKELNISVVALSQLSRDRTNPKPMKNRLRGSGQIEEAADTLLLLWRPEEYDIDQFDQPYEDISTKGLAEIFIAKGRNIGTARFLLGFNEETTLFYDYSPEFENLKQYNPDGFIEPFIES